MTAWGLYINIFLGYGGIAELMWLTGAPLFMCITFIVLTPCIFVWCWWDIDGWMWWFNRGLKKTLADLEARND